MANPSLKTKVCDQHKTQDYIVFMRPSLCKEFYKGRCAKCGKEYVERV